jgi:hypothetical protein
MLYKGIVSSRSDNEINYYCRCYYSIFPHSILSFKASPFAANFYSESWLLFIDRDAYYKD